MKRLFTLLLTCLSGTAFLQTNVVNPSFETWNDEVVYDSLEFWSTSAAQMYFQGLEPNTWQDDEDPYDGDFSVYMETVFVFDDDLGEDDTIFGYCVKESADDGGFSGFPYTDSVDQFSFWYKCDVMPGDSAVAIIQLSKDGAIYAGAQFKMSGTVSDWTEAIVPIPGGDLEAPDSIWVGFASSDPFTPGIADEGSVLEIDLVTLQFTAGSIVPAEIPNNSFEDLIELTIEVADDWHGFNTALYLFAGENYAEQSSDASDGSSSLLLTTTTANVAFDIPALVTNGEFYIGESEPEGGDPFIAQPEEMLIDFQYAPAGTDTAICWLQIWNSSETVVDTFVIFTNTVSSWTTDTVELSFSSAPDSVNIVLYSGANLGSEFMVDNIRFEGGDLGTETIYLSDKWNLFPNPANEVATVVFNEADRISVINLAGQEIYRMNAPNSNQIQLNTADWPEGIYMIQLANNGKLETKKLVVTH